MSASRLAVPLLSNASTTGGWVEWPGGFGRLELSGAVGGATITLQVKDSDGTTAHTVSPETTMIASGTSGFVLEAGADIRLHVSGGTPSGLNAYAYRI